MTTTQTIMTTTTTMLGVQFEGMAEHKNDDARLQKTDEQTFQKVTISGLAYVPFGRKKTNARKTNTDETSTVQLPSKIYRNACI